MTTRETVVKTTQIGGALVVLVCLVLWMSGFFGTKIPPGTVAAGVQRAPADATVATVEAAVVPVIEEAAGTVQAERKTVVSSRVVAVVREVHVRAGDEVERGRPLVTLDDREASARVLEARRAAEAAEAARHRAESDYKRAHTLLGRGVVSRSEFDQAESAYRIADAEWERARQALQGAEVSLTYTEITAPVAGRVVDRFADPGDTALPGQPLLALYDPTALRIEVPVRESLVARLKVGASLQVRLAADAEPVRGTVDEIVPQAEAGSRTFLVKVGLPRREGIYTGMFGRVLIPAGERTRVLAPAAAIERIGQLRFATVVGDDRRLSKRLVTLGPPAGSGLVEVLSGLQAGETVLLADHATPPPGR